MLFFQYQGFISVLGEYSLEILILNDEMSSDSLPHIRNDFGNGDSSR